MADVPSVTGLPYNEAMQALTQAGFHPAVAYAQQSTGNGTIVSQDPPAARRPREGDSYDHAIGLGAGARHRRNDAREGVRHALGLWLPGFQAGVHDQRRRRRQGRRNDAAGGHDARPGLVGDDHRQRNAAALAKHAPCESSVSIRPCERPVTASIEVPRRCAVSDRSGRRRATGARYARAAAARAACRHLRSDRASRNPAAIVIEELYTSYKNPRTAVLMGHARGVLCLAGAQAGVAVHTLGHAHVKRALVGSGSARK